MARPSDWRTKLTQDVLFEAVDLLIKGCPAEAVAKKFSPLLGEAFTRQQVYKLLNIAAAQNLLVVQPPHVDSITEKLIAAHGIPRNSLRVVGVRGKNAIEHLATSTADLLFSLVMNLKRERSKKTVHIAVGSGRSTNLVCARLGAKLHAELARPNIVIHALTGGWDSGTLVSPVSHFSHFQFTDQDEPSVEFVNLSVPPLVPVEDFSGIRNLPFIRDAFERFSEVDIVVSSIGNRHDDHCTFAEAMNLRWVREYGNPKKKLDQQGWVGDIQYLPYNELGPIEMGGLKACVLMSFADLVKMAQLADKFVVVLVGPCGRCGKSKAPALLPLVSSVKLRVFSHLVLDLTTGEDLLRSGGAG